MNAIATSAESRLTRLLERLLNAAELSLAAGDFETARAMAEEVRAVDPDNTRAERVLHRVASRNLAPTGERALMTLVFSDLVGSTLLSERVEPENLRDLFMFYRAAARDAVERYKGHVMQYTGDGILACFGYPTPHEDDARRAVLAGLDLVTAMRDARTELASRLGAAPDVRVGIHTGRVVVTDLSSERSVAERDSIVGVAPNLAARIQQAAEPGMVVISDVTHTLVDADFYVRSLGDRVLKGISRPVEVYAVDRPRYAGARFEAERYRKAGLVGRDEPRDRLLSAWTSVRESPEHAPEQAVEQTVGTSFLVVGEAGIGKTRLVAEILDRVEASGGSVLGAACLPYYDNVSLWPVARLLERVLGVAAEGADRLPALVAHLTALGLEPWRSVPFLAPLIGITDDYEYPAPQLDPSAFLEETLNQLVAWVSALAERSPHLFIVEDLHWADPSTLELLARLVDRRPHALLTLTTTRDESVVPWRDNAVVLHLDRLDAGASTRLVDNLSSGKHLAREQRAAIAAHAEGIPLFIEELTSSYLDDSLSEAMPLRLQELFTWRLKAPEVNLRVVQVAATVGPTFDAGTVSAIMGSEDTVAAQLEILAAQQIIEPVDPVARTFRFRHALMRDAAYETQVLDVRSKTHELVAGTLTARGAEPALVAEHLDLAGQAGRASELYLLAAQGEQSRGAHPEATQLLSRVIELLDTLPESDERHLAELTARMLRAFSVSSMQGYGAPEVQFDHRRAEALATGLGTRPEVLPSLIAIWSYWLVHGELGTSRGLIDRLMGMVGEAAFSWFEPEVESCAGWQDFFEGRLGPARWHLERAADGFLARPPEEAVSPFWPLPHDPIAVSECALACVNALQGEITQGERWEQQAVQRAEDIGFPRGPFSLAFIKTFAAWLRRYLGDQEASWKLGSEVVAIGQEHGYAFWTALGSAYVAFGTPGGDAHRGFLEQVISTLRVMGQESFAAAHLAELARLHAAAGDLDRAQALADEALEVVHKAGDNLHLPEILRLGASYRLSRGVDTEAAVANLNEAIRVATEQGARIARLRAAVELARVAPDLRPEGWHTLLSQAREDMPSALTTADTVAADQLLAV